MVSRLQLLGSESRFFVHGQRFQLRSVVIDINQKVFYGPDSESAILVKCIEYKFHDKEKIRYKIIQGVHTKLWPLLQIYMKYASFKSL